MRLNANFDERVILRPQERRWTPSPQAGIDRQMLDRVGGEVGRATSLVRYAPGSRFAAHTHGGGEEILVVDGEYADENGRYPAGTYVRNPIGSHHAPFSDTGCVLFVKLHQFAADDIHPVIVNSRASDDWQQGLVDGLRVLPLHSHGTEHVALVNWEPGTTFRRHRHWGGEEILVLRGTFEDARGVYPTGTWLRSPDGSEHTPFSREGCLLYVKTGHLTPGMLAAWRAPTLAA